MNMGIIKNNIQFIHNTDIFGAHHSNIYIAREDLLTIQAYTVDIRNKRNNLLSTMGEFFEREVLINHHQAEDDEVISFSMIDGKIKKIRKDKVVFRKKFVDSCGMASHTDSKEVIQKAFFEFIERQFFVFNYLSKSSGKYININRYSNSVILSYNKYLLNYVDNIKYYDISLCSELHVVIGIGLGEKNKCVGIGTHYEIMTAIEKAQQEMLQYFANTMSKHCNEELGFLLPDTPEVQDEYNTYFNNLTVDELEKHYDYLGNEKKIYEENNRKSKFQIRKILLKIRDELGIDPYVVFFANQRNMSHLKVIKIIDYNWFPHMFPRLYTKENYEFVEKVMGVKLDRNCNLIPFA